MLEDHPDALAEAPQAVGIERGDIFAVDQDAPAGGFLEAVDQTQQRALAGARMADQAEDFTGGDLQLRRLQGRDVSAAGPIGFVDLMEFDHGRTLWVRRSLPGYSAKAGHSTRLPVGSLECAHSID